MSKLVDLYNRSIFANLPTAPKAAPDKPIPPLASPPKESPLKSIVTPTRMPPPTNYKNLPTANIYITPTTSMVNLFNANVATVYGGKTQPNYDFQIGEGRGYPIRTGVKNAKNITEWMFSNGSGLLFTAKQFFLQALNPTLETKIWNPLSIPLSSTPGIHVNRHASFASLSRLVNLIPGLGGPLSQYVDISNYETSVKRIPYSFIGRAANQNPGQPSSEMPGVKYAEWGLSQMTKPSTWKNINPNRYMFPIASDLAGFPLSSRPSPREEMERNIGLAIQGSYFTKATGFNPPVENQTSPFKSMLSGILRSLIPEGVRRPVAQALGLIERYNFSQIKIYNRYNPTFPYIKAGVIRGLNENENEKIDYRSPDSPQTLMLSAFEAIGESRASTAKIPFTFQSSKEALDPRIPIDKRVKVNDYLQTYGDIVKKSRGKKIGALGPKQGDKDIPTYIQRLTDEGKPLVHKTFGIADSGNPIDPESRLDKINMLDYGEDYPQGLQDLIPFKFYHVNKKKYIIFRALVTGISEEFSPTWNEKSYVGRADPVFTYAHTVRSLSFSFDIFPMSAKELKPLYRKLNYLIGLVYPDYQSHSGEENDAGQYMRAPFVRLTIGDLYDGIYGIIGGLSVSFDDGMPWETQKTTLDDGTELIRVPRYITVTVSSFKIVGNRNEPFGSNSVFIGTYDFIRG